MRRAPTLRLVKALPVDHRTLRPLSVAFLADYYCGWMGGANLFGFIFRCAQLAAAAQNVRLHLLLSAGMLPPAARQGIDGFLPLGAGQIAADGPLRALLDTASPELVIFYADSARTLDLLHVDVIGPTGFDLRSTAGGRPWFAYIPDFQHQYLQQFFTQEQRLARDRQFRLLVENATGVFVNSATVAADIERFYPGASRSVPILRLPQLLPETDHRSAQDIDAVFARYGIRRPYVLSCSQRWLHKRHDLIVEAFARVAQRHPQLHLVFTGERTDHRDRDYAARVDATIERHGLADRVHSVGLIPRDEQLALIAHARAVVQASVFEGGPGASGTLEAALLGTPVIASDIAANRELTFAPARFFETDSIESLVAAIERTLAHADGERAPPFTKDERDVLAMASGLNFLATLRAAAHRARPEAW